MKESPRPLSLAELIAEGVPPPPLQLGDRVVWISDSGPEYGVVRWLGKLPDVGREWMAGVDFDHPVGSGTGLYNDYQLFEAKINHASLVPVIGLMKAEDFLNPGASSSDSHDQIDSVSSDWDSSSRNNRASGSNRIKNEFDRTPLPPLNTNRGARASSPPSITRHIANLSLESQRSLSSLEREKGSRNRFPLPSPGGMSANEYGMADGAAATGAPRSVSSDQIKLNSSGYAKNDRESKPTQDKGPTANGVVSHTSLDIGSMVETVIDSRPVYGVIRWVGLLRRSRDDDDALYAGIELEEEHILANDGTFDGRRYFECAPQRGHFAKLKDCKRDPRFGSEQERRRSELFGSIECPTVTGDVPPLSCYDDFQALCGKNRGIQGHHNSCYLDATLFAMFSCTTIFESLLGRPRTSQDIPEYEEVQRVLKEEIVNPLRANLYVRGDRVMQLRTLLEKLTSVRGLTSEEKDPEEFLNLLLNQILKAEPYLKLSSGLESFFYQLFLEKDEKLVLPSVQQLFDQSFLASDIKLRQVPACLLIQMPRFGRQFKMYSRILPSLYLDITDVLENSPRQCAICGQVAEVECKECFGQFGEGLDSTAFCNSCWDKSHGAHKRRSKHQCTKLSVPVEFRAFNEHTVVPRIYMELFAVLCIETSHYVSFVKCGSGPDAPWCFFDSMADRKGEQNGYNIPEVVSFPDLKWWLSDEGNQFLLSTKDDKMLPEMARRLICDAYLCFYQSPDMMMYR